MYKRQTLEGGVVRLSDKIAYINHDIDDAIRARIFTEEEIPSEYTKVLGHSVRERLNTMIPVSYTHLRTACCQYGEKSSCFLNKYVFFPVLRCV